MPNLMKTHDCYRALAALNDGHLVVCHLGSSTKEWHRIHGVEDHSFHMHTMSMAGSFGLGLALARPDDPVWVLDSDGGTCMNLGSILSEAVHQPPNLIHFVLSNRRYVTIAGPGVVNHEQTDYGAIARGAGIRNVYTFDKLENFEAKIGAIVTANEHAYVVLEVEAELEHRPLIPYEGQEHKYRFARYLEREKGIKALGPTGI
jgi:thiamine pyrophosphate-dependent acetolactate synthase large subunit-like protein